MIRSVFLATALLASATATAQDSDQPKEARFTANSYSYLEISGQVYNMDEDLAVPTRYGSEVYESLPGLGLGGSFQFLDYAFGYVDVRAFSKEGDNTELELSMADFGGGLVYPVVDQLDTLVTLAYTTATVEVSSHHIHAESDLDGYALGAGVRYRFNEKFNLLAKLDRRELEAEESEGEEDGFNTVKLELRGGQKGHGVIVGGEYWDEDTILKFGYRYTFD